MWESMSACMWVCLYECVWKWVSVCVCESECVCLWTYPVVRFKDPSSLWKVLEHLKSVAHGNEEKTEWKCFNGLFLAIGTWNKGSPLSLPRHTIFCLRVPQNVTEVTWNSNMKQKWGGWGLPGTFSQKTITSQFFIRILGESCNFSSRVTWLWTAYAAVYKGAMKSQYTTVCMQAQATTLMSCSTNHQPFLSLWDSLWNVLKKQS